MAVARQVPTPILEGKIEKSGRRPERRRGGVGMGSKSGRAHALGCPEWVPPGAGSRGGVLGMLWWFPCPSGPMHAIDADTDGILMHTCIYIQILTIPTYTYVYMHIYAYTYAYMHIHAHTRHPQLETAISRQPVSRSIRAKEQI